MEGPLNQLAEQVHQTAVDHGWWEQDRNFGEVLALMHSELSEALEEWRDDNLQTYAVIEGTKVPYAWIDANNKRKHKPEGVAVELIDVMVRVLDWLGSEGYDIDEVWAWKTSYNEGRPYRHGGKRA